MRAAIQHPFDLGDVPREMSLLSMSLAPVPAVIQQALIRHADEGGLADAKALGRFPGFHPERLEAFVGHGSAFLLGCLEISNGWKWLQALLFEVVVDGEQPHCHWVALATTEVQPPFLI